jgi:hypothetical protein
VAVGWRSLYANTVANNNTSIGESAMIALTTGDNNTGVGNFVLNGLTTGTMNTAIGKSAGESITTGIYNTIIGGNLRTGITTGSYNTIIGGFLNGLSSSLSNNVIIADGSGNIRFQWDGTNIKLNNNIVGSNAFTSTAFLPLTGGTLSGQLNSNSNFNAANFFISAGTSQPATSASVGMSANLTTGYLDITGYTYGLRIVKSQVGSYGATIATFENNGNITTTGGNTLEGVTNIKPNADFTITQNSVVPFTSVSSGAIANSLYLTGRKVGFGTATPRTSASGSSNTIDVKGGIYFGSTASESCTINNDDSFICNFDANNDGGTSNFFSIAKGRTGESGGSEYFRVAGNGNVLIGSITDNGAKLQVNGSVNLGKLFSNYSGSVYINNSTVSTIIDLSAIMGNHDSAIISIGQTDSNKLAKATVIVQRSAYTSGVTYSVATLGTQPIAAYLTFSISGANLQMQTTGGAATFAYNAIILPAY